MNKLNIWCWTKSIDWYINVDSLKLPWVDVVHDLNSYPYPFEDDSCDEIWADNVIEHLDDMILLFEEIYRILKPWGVFRGIVPYFAHPCAFADPTHKQYFSLGTFDYFTKDFEYNFYTNARFEITQLKLIIWWISGLFKFVTKRKPRFYELYISRIFPASWIEFILTKTHD